MDDLTNKTNIEQFDSANRDALSYVKNKQYELAYDILTNLCDTYNAWTKQCTNVDVSTTEIYDYMKFVYFNLGNIYTSLDSSYYDINKAIEYFNMSGTIGYAAAYRYIAYIYDPNISIIKIYGFKNLENARIYYKKAISVDGDYTSLNNLGVTYGNENDYKLGAFYCWLAYKLGNAEEFLNNYNTYKSYLVDDVQKYIESLSNVSTNNIEALTESYLVFCSRLTDVYNHKKEQETEQAQKTAAINTVKLVVGIAVLVLCAILLVKCIVWISIPDGICDHAGCEETATRALGDMEFCVPHYIEWIVKAS
ncbi:MAG: hypothetical protein GX641_04030 [Mollicutes bacterium]|nr:hypothetical protein [Mollicutes bacterium]